MKPLNLKVLILLLIISLTAVSQENKITLSSERNSDNSVSIYAESQAHGEYTVKVHFISLAGYSASANIFGNNALTVVEMGKRQIIKLSMEKNASSYTYQYSYTYMPGRSLRRYPDSSVAYLLPATPGNQIRVSGFGSLATILGQTDNEHMLGHTFYYKANDTICATRAGLVYECNDDVKEGETSEVYFRKHRNSIAIQHKDGTAGHYQMLSPIKLLVKAGEYVIPGQPIGVFNKESERYAMMFYSCFLDEKKFLIDRDPTIQNQPSAWSYMPLHFFTDNNETVNLQANKAYTVKYNKDLVAVELSKKEKKKFGIE